ncbi:MAG: PIG-L family deacetylase [Clostridia bacterium]|nr:PIG-L family deacetylase [Clostridia bacterium]
MKKIDYEHLRVLVVGAHQDDPEKCGGAAIKFARLGHTVKFLCATNGQSGHQTYPGYQTVKIREAEKNRARDVLGIAEYDCLDINDGYLTTEIHNRERMMRTIREFAPDIIITHRPWDYHPDHRNTGLLVQDCSYLLRVPNFLPTVPVMEKLPLIFYMRDSFRKPNAFTPDVVIDIDDVSEQRLLAYAQHESQVFDWLQWVDGADPASVPTDQEGRMQLIRDMYLPRCAVTDAMREKLAERYGAEHAARVQYCEAYEACEYGASHEGVDYKKLFPF